MLFDVVLGYDPGLGTYDDLKEALECGRAATLIGSASLDSPVLFDIDPGGLGPLPEPDEFEMNSPAEHELDLYTLPPEADDTPPPELTEPPLLANEVVELVEELEPAEVEDVAIDVAATDDDDNDDETSDGRDAWARLLALWADRIADPDDDYADRWTGPDIEYFEWVDLAALRTESACDNCDRVELLLWSCAWCGGAHCAECALQDEDDKVWCKSCIAELDDPASEPSYGDAVDVSIEPVVSEDDEDDDDDEYEDDETF